MPYLERIPTHRSLMLLAVLFAALYLPNLATRQLRFSEALYGTVAEEMVRDRSIWVTQVHGDPVEQYPFYPWLVAGCQALGAEQEWAVRLPAVISIALMAALSGAMAYRYGGPLAGILAAGMILTNIACLRVGRRAQSETVLACLLSASWFTWYVLGQRRKRWALAWTCALVLLLPATFTAGARAIAYFYLPFLFLRRPVKGRRRLALPSHLVPLGLFVAAVMTWLHHVPGQALFPWNELRTMPAVTTLSYPLDLILFPLKCAVYLFPWSCLAWPPFCMAYRRLEISPVTFHYLRTIVLSTFIAAWLLPHVSPLSLLPVLPALAIMTGLHAETLLRRHIAQLRRLPTALAAAGLTASLSGLLIALLHLSGIIDFQDLEIEVAYYNSCIMAVAAVTAAMLLRGPLRRQPFRIQLLLSFTTVGLVVISLRDPWLAWAGNERKEAGEVLAGRHEAPTYLLADSSDMIPAEDTAETTDTSRDEPTGTAVLPLTKTTDAGPVYRPISASPIFQTTRSYYVVPCFYLGQPVRRVQNAREDIPLPEPAGQDDALQWMTALQTNPENDLDPGTIHRYLDAVYALSAGGPPILPELEWEALTPALDLAARKRIRASWLPGGFCLVRLRTAGEEIDRTTDLEPVQIFRGVRR